MRSAPSGRHGPPRRKEVLDLLVREHPRLIRFVIYLGAGLPDAEMIVRAVYAEFWRSLTAQRNPLPSDIELSKEIRKAAYRQYAHPVVIQPPLPVVIARNLEKISADPANNYADLTPGTAFVLRAWRNLDSRQRAVLAFQMEGFSMSEIAEQLGIDKDSATSAFDKARKTMARELAGCRVQERRIH